MTLGGSLDLKHKFDIISCPFFVTLTAKVDGIARYIYQLLLETQAHCR